MTDRPGLRERKRQATHRSIQLAVLSLIEERGLDRVTVEEISDRADVSPRTFFNYFPSKEAAALGDTPALPEGDVQARFLDSEGPLLHDVGELLAATLYESAEQLELLQLRTKIFKQHPQLFAMRMASMRSFEDELAALIAKRLAARSSTTSTSAVDDTSRLISHVSMAAVRHGWSNWTTTAADGRTPLAELVRRSFGMLAELFEGDSAIAASARSAGSDR